MKVRLLTIICLFLLYTNTAFSQVYNIASSGITFDIPETYIVITPTDISAANKLVSLSDKDKSALINEMKQQNIVLYALDTKNSFEFAIVYKIDENSRATGDNRYLDNLKNNKQKLDELKSGLEKSFGRNVYNFEIKKIKNENFLVAQSTILGEQTITFTKHYLTVIDGASLGLNAFYHGKNWKDFPHYELERIFFTMKVPQEKTISKQQSTSIVYSDPQTSQNMDTLNSKALYKGFVGACSAAVVMIAIFAFKFIKEKFTKKD